MSSPVGLLVVMWVSLTAYAVLAGADFGAGVWDLLAGRAGPGRPRRALIEHVIGPVWEANHVWLIFVLVLLWTCFPGVFAAIASTLYVPLTAAALGIIGRGAAFAFRKVAGGPGRQRAFGAVFAASSVLTPFSLGAAAGAIATGRVPAGIAAGSVLGSWCTPTSLLTGLLAVATCAYLAAVYLAGDARRRDRTLIGWFRRRALVSGVLTGALALAGLLVVRADAPELATGLLSGRGAIAVAASVVAGCGSLILVTTRALIAARVAAAAAVATLVWGWGLARYPRLLPGVDAAAAAADPATLRATTVTVLAGLTLLVPSMLLLFTLFRHDPRAHG